jgi:hypothetical protein
MTSSAHTDQPTNSTTTGAAYVAALLEHDRLHPSPLDLDLERPAVRAIIALFVELKTAEHADGSWNGGDTVSTLTRWFTGLGIDPERSATSLIRDLARAVQRPDPTADKDCAELAIPALQAYREHTGARAGDFDDPEVLIEVGGDLIADLFHLARDAGLTPDALIDPALRHLHDETPHDSDEKNTVPAEHASEEFDMDEVARLVRAAGVDCVLDTSGGGCATIWAGPRRHKEGWGPRFAALAGPGRFGWGRVPSVALVEDFYVGPDAADADATSTAQVGARTPELIAKLIVAQARKADPTQLLSFDEIEALGLDGALRQS